MVVFVIIIIIFLLTSRRKLKRSFPNFENGLKMYKIFFFKTLKENLQFTTWCEYFKLKLNRFSVISETLVLN